MRTKTWTSRCLIPAFDGALLSPEWRERQVFVTRHTQLYDKKFRGLTPNCCRNRDEKWAWLTKPQR